ncbi:pentapeptide repeat-containing protein [Brevundimonas diminuta]|uniref:pentapeptide repeat-containing protein n=1 Tax=Brevundimonas diminuta TaxID=293 RepID=UPI003D020B86
MYDYVHDQFSISIGADDLARRHDGEPLFGQIENVCFENQTIDARSADLHFLNCTFVKVRWSADSLLNARFERCTFDGAVFSGVLFDACAFVACRSLENGVDFSRAVFRYSEVSACAFLHATFDGADVSRLAVRNSRLDHARWKGALFARNVAGSRTVSEFSLSDSLLRRSSLADAVLTGADFYGAQLVDCDLSRADLERTTFARGGFQNVKLGGALLSGADLRGVRFRQTDLSAARDWSGARVDPEALEGLLPALGFKIS